MLGRRFISPAAELSRRGTGIFKPEAGTCSSPCAMSFEAGACFHSGDSLSRCQRCSLAWLSSRSPTSQSHDELPIVHEINPKHLALARS